MNNQLSTISTQYRKFSKGQYIEHTQFNEFLDFFEDQDRLSRVMLQGVGVVCGLQPQLIYTDKRLSSIQLSQGVAITTDGDLLTLSNKNKASKDLYVSDLKTIDIENKQYTYFKAYDDYKVHYPAFYDDDGNQIALWELATTTEARLDFQPMENLDNLEDKYLLLYLESYEKEIKPCRGVDCDNHGIQLTRNLKVLLTDRAGIDQILTKDKVYPHPMLTGLMVDKKLERVILEPQPTSVGDLLQAYQTIVLNSNYYDTMFNSIDVISSIIGISSPDRQSFIEKLYDVLSQNQGFQYAYDVMRDLTDTYTEIIKLLPKSLTKCLPDLLSFPKHIMLGKLISNTNLDYTRHQFYNSPVLDDEKTSQRVELLIKRFNEQTSQFQSTQEKDFKIKIIPSQKLNPLSNKAIPFYYDVTEDFLKTWNFDKTRNRVSNTNLAFDTTFLSGDSYIQYPFEYNIDKKPFYAIEGHQGIAYQTAVDEINDIKDKQQLGFDVVALSLKELIGNKDLSKAYFIDYVEKNPGLEHKGGVERGGTFIVVYKSEEEPIIVADFSLPYICCTPKETVKLSLPNSVICADAKPIPFTVSPLGGVVKANVADQVVFVNANGQYFFDPSKVTDPLLNQDITFTINGKPTNCTIKVIPQPDIHVVVSNVFYPEAGSNTTVTITVSGTNFTDFDYKWDFLGNGNYINIKPDTQGKVIYTYFNLDINRIPVIQVLISGNGCSQSTTLNNWYTPQSNVLTINSMVTTPCCEKAISDTVIISGVNFTNPCCDNSSYYSNINTAKGNNTIGTL